MRKVDPPEPPVARCPACDGIGKPFHLETKVGSVIVHLRCPYCGVEWKKVKSEPKTT
jgi:DNA-directed RNA polymerase subunit RPC12/RpoP